MEERKCVYCFNCGQKNNGDSKYCQNCGTRLITSDIRLYENEEQIQPSTYTERKQEYVGKILKCPSCGAELPSFTAICPVCGHEINTQDVSPSLKVLINSINEFDKDITNNQEKTVKGWKSWGNDKRFLWIVLNIFTLFIPLVIYLVFPNLIKPLFFQKSTSALSLNERRKAYYIENYVFPNERESTIEAILFAKSKMEFLVSDKYNKKELYWINLWGAKAKQLYKKADIILKGDRTIETTYGEILSIQKKVKDKVRLRALIGTVIVIAYLLLSSYVGYNFFKGFNDEAKNLFSNFTISGNNSNSSDSNDEKFEWLESGLSTKIPKIDANKGKIHTNNDTELELEVDEITYAYFENYIELCKELGYSVESVKDTTEYTAFNDEGFLLKLSYSNYHSKLEIELNAPQKGIADYEWPANPLAELIPKITFTSGTTNTDKENKCEIYLFDISYDEFTEYIKICKNSGFSVDSDSSDNRFEGFNSDGYRLEVSINEMKRMTITIQAPMEMSEIKWPTTGVAECLPKTKSNIGVISTNSSSILGMYIGDTTLEDLSDYIDTCISQGFNKDVYRSDTYFSAENKYGDSLSIQYYGYNIIYISAFNFKR